MDIDPPPEAFKPEEWIGKGKKYDNLNVPFYVIAA